MAGATTLAAPTVLRAQTAWDMPVPYTDGTYHTQNVRWWVEEIAKATGGSMKIQVHSNNSLIRLPEILRAVSTGQVAAGEILISQFGNEDPFYELDSIPFLAQGLDQATKLYEASKAALQASLQKRGIRMLYSVAWPSQAFYSKTPINSAADMRGMKFRTVSPITSRMAELLGAVPTAVQASEVPQAFATNIVTGMITSGATGVQSRAWEFASQFVNLRASMPKNAVLVNERAWLRLPEPVRQAMLAASAQAEPRGWKLAAEVEIASVEELRKNGMTIVDPTPQLLTEVKAVGAKLTEEWIGKTGDAGKAVIENFNSRIRA
ncbi:C4-dicarboxylate ABC transporter substrate-binding protein [Phreatobacter stygius]|uniref:C4-dicarboxylate ABC transporter substrate-binding protein n=2 Tax=Phreatobacter stygius TaxID=1940610 RepID=A0A4D7BN35_9HYPH|nr:C4-dicarboxylate ABC transporter substrate-binding protein [Phreatobacter stygius]